MLLAIKSLVDWFRHGIDVVKAEIENYQKCKTKGGCVECDPVGYTEETKTYVVEPVSTPETPFEKAKKAFNPKTDIMVISESKVASLKLADQLWLHAQGNRIHYFPGSTLSNIALVSTSW